MHSLAQHGNFGTLGPFLFRLKPYYVLRQGSLKVMCACCSAYIPLSLLPAFEGSGN